MDCHSLLQGIFLTQGSNPGLLHWQLVSLPLSHLGSPQPSPNNYHHVHTPIHHTLSFPPQPENHEATARHHHIQYSARNHVEPREDLYSYCLKASCETCHSNLGFPKEKLGYLWCLSSKASTCQCRRCGFSPWVGKIPWRRK